MTTIITPAEIREGDAPINKDGRVGWVAQQDATTDNDARTIIGTGVQVQHIDGGIDWRFWDTNTDVRFSAIKTLNGRQLKMEV